MGCVISFAHLTACDVGFFLQEQRAWFISAAILVWPNWTLFILNIWQVLMHQQDIKVYIILQMYTFRLQSKVWQMLAELSLHHIFKLWHLNFEQWKK